MADNKDQILLNEKVSFIQNNLPGLDAGAYQVVVSQEVYEGTTRLSDDSLINTYTFAVKGDRFSVTNPADTIYSVFPADNATGAFDNVLPHVVFRKKTFPWIRYLSGKEPQDKVKDVPTWLAVLVLDEDDAGRFPSLQLTPRTGTISDLCSDGAGLYSCFPDKSDLKDLDLGEQAGDLVRIIDIPLPLFSQIAPTEEDLKFTAHARKVSLINKTTVQGVSDQGEPTGHFSVVFSNRLPQDNRKSYAYLVSLEGMAEYLPADEAQPLPDSAPGTIRLAVLHSWSFFSNGQPARFNDMVYALNGSNKAGTALCLPYSGKNIQVKSMLQMGYVPLNQNLRNGEKLVSWYRGPLVPYPVNISRIQVPVSAPDKITVFDPTTGMLDTSYAAAWTIGRLVALQDKGFSTSLYNWKQGLSQAVVSGVETALLMERFADETEKSSTEGATAEGKALVKEGRNKSLRNKMLNALIQPE